MHPLRSLLRGLCGAALFAFSPVLSLAQPAAQSEAAIESERFDIERFEVRGNTLLAQEEADAAVQPFAGKGRSYADVQRALEALELRYRSRGYGAVQVHVPEQELGGTVRLDVIELKLRRVDFNGAALFDEENIRRSLPALQIGTSPNASALSSSVALANENPSKQVEVVLKATDEEGMLDARVDVSEQPVSKIFVTVDNTGNESTGAYRLGVGYQHANLWNRDHVMTANYATSPEKPDRVSIYSFSYRLPLYELGHSMDFIIARSNVNAGTTPIVGGNLAFAGSGDVYGFRYNQLLARRGEFTHRLVYGLDIKAFDNSCSINLANIPEQGCGTSSADVTLRPLSVTYSGQLAQAGRVGDFSLAAVKNIRGGSGGRQDDFTAARNNGAEGARAGYHFLRASGSMTWAFSDRTQLRAALSTQFSRRALLPAEQLGVAGSTAVRGFFEREISGDNGWFANLEYYSPDWAKSLGLSEGNLRALAFYDLGSARNVQLPLEPHRKASIASAGIGVRWNLEKNYTLRFDLARIVDEGASRAEGRFRGHLSLYLAF